MKEKGNPERKRESEEQASTQWGGKAPKTKGKFQRKPRENRLGFRAMSPLGGGEIFIPPKDFVHFFKKWGHAA